MKRLWMILGIILAMGLFAPPAQADDLDQITPASSDATFDPGYVIDGCHYDYKITMTVYDRLGWWIFRYTGVASWCYDGYGVSWHSFTTGWAGRFGWYLDSQDIVVDHSPGSEHGRYFWWARYGAGHFKDCQYGYCLTDGVWVRQTVLGNGGIEQRGGDL